MPMNYVTMWGMLILMAFGAVGGALIHGDLLGSIRGAYPSDPLQRHALQRCGEMDSGFSRFSAGANSVQKKRSGSAARRRRRRSLDDAINRP